MNAYDLQKISAPPATAVVDLFPQTSCRDGLWTNSGLSQIVITDKKIIFHRNRSLYRDGCRLLLRLNPGDDYRLSIVFSKISSSVDIKCLSEILNIDAASVGKRVSLPISPKSNQTVVFFQAPNDWDGSFEISSLKLSRLTAGQTDLFAGTLGRTGGSLDRGLYGPVQGDAGDTDAIALKTVLCPLVAAELPRVLENLERWNDRLHPLEADHADIERPGLVFSFNCGPDPELSTAIVQAAERLDRVKSAFSTIEVMFCSLPAEKDIYIRTPSPTPPDYGFKAGPNWLFYESLRRLRGRGGMLFLMEADCHPMVSGWLGRLAKVAARHLDAWIIGGVYSGVSNLDPTIVRHINGNALYNLEDPRFHLFIDEFWEWMLDYIKERDPNLAYDCAWEVFAHSSNTHKHKYDRSGVVKRVASKFRVADFIVNVGGQVEQEGRYAFSERELRRRFPHAILAHGPVSEFGAHERGDLSVGRLRHDLQSAGSEDGGAVVATFFERPFWLTSDSFRPDDRLEFRIEFEGEVDLDWLFRVTQLNGVNVPIELIEAEQIWSGSELRLWTTVTTETHLLMFRIEAAAGQMGFRLMDLSVSVERNSRLLIDQSSLL